MSRRQAEYGDEDPRREEVRLQYKSLILPLQFYLFMKCAGTDLDPRKVADEAYISVFSQRYGLRNYRALRHRADAIVDERMGGGIDERVDNYSLAQLFDTYFRGKYPVVREGMSALDELTVEERKPLEDGLLELLGDENFAAVMGVAVFENREQERGKLAKLTDANVDLSVLRLFFADVRRGASGDQDR
ncbi:hypothetical protein [Streptomyces sp. NPDC056660]|uniref:hypothetical protein n=1 Tax=Streptomyces sp. NPDC056660 TaxID=3345897 RepID=UPI0036BFDF67